MYRPCECGHRKYKHGAYPLDWPYCKDKNLPKHSPNSCLCIQYVPMSNLKYLELKHSQKVDKIKNIHKV